MLDQKTREEVNKTVKIVNGEKIKEVFGSDCEFAIMGIMTEAMLCAGIKKGRMIEALYFAGEAIDKLSVQELRDSYIDFMHNGKKKSKLEKSIKRLLN